MNSSVYLFGNLSSGYTQYPDEDFSSAIFHTFYQRAKATTQIAIHRDGHLMYYSYIRKLEQDQYIGLCVLLNDAMVTNFGNMFALFENAISCLAEKGHLIRYNENGNLVANAEKLFKKPEEVELVTESLKRGFENLANSAQKLPPENFSVGKDSTKAFSVEDAAIDILQSSYTNGYTYIYKSKDFDTAQMTSYKGVLAKITKENLSLKDRNKELEEKNRKILRQKKQFTTVVSLFVILLIGLGFLLSINDDLQWTITKLDTTTQSLDSTKNVVTAQNGQIQQLSGEKQTLNTKLEKTIQELSDAREEIGRKDNIIAEKESRISSLENTVSFLQYDKSSLQKSLNTANSTISTLRQSVTTLQKNYDNVKEENRELIKEYNKLSNTIRELSSQRKKR